MDACDGDDGRVVVMASRAVLRRRERLAMADGGGDI